MAARGKAIAPPVTPVNHPRTRNHFPIKVGPAAERAAHVFRVREIQVTTDEMFDRLKSHVWHSFAALPAQVHPANVLADRDRPCREGTATLEAVHAFKDMNPTVLKQVVRMVVVPCEVADCHPNAGAEFPDDFR